MKRILAALVLVLVLPMNAEALETKELLALAAMPLAVAAVADLADVPTRDFVDVIAAMNRASVPPTQFVEVVRYVPVALVDETEPRFVTYVTTRVDEGLTGSTLALAMQDRIRTYGVTDINVGSPSVVLVDDDFFPPVVVSRFQPVQFDPVSLVAMPLAVAAVADLADIPVNDFVSFVSLLNQAAVPPRQFVEVVRYVPVALVDDGSDFLRFATMEVERGLIGNAFALSLADRIRLLGVDEIDVVSPPVFTVVERAEFIPPVVVTRVAEARAGHPHGGPPGQLKKDLGLQTGAEVVHGSKPGTGNVVRKSSRQRPVVIRDDDRGRDKQRKVVVRDDRRDKPAKIKVKPERVSPPKARGNRGPDRVKIDASPPGRGKPQGAHAGKGQGGGQSKANPGKGKGKGKG